MCEDIPALLYRIFRPIEMLDSGENALFSSYGSKAMKDFIEFNKLKMGERVCENSEFKFSWIQNVASNCVF